MTRTAITAAGWERSGRAALVLLGVLGACSSALPPPPAPDPAADARIEREVEARLAAEPSIPPGSIRVEVVGGDVRLHGGVNGIGAWQCALRNAALVEGVHTVIDYLILGRGPREVRCLAPSREMAP
ncbi:MAG TPA: BON domain-containing protein [Longimicrobiaceae bacterium]|jgi:hypothetical protein|nr:BON domain-containing protein [Longimicrobiaceae bacterium]